MGRRRFLYVWPVILVMWGYVMLTGLQPPVVRATIMGTLFMLAEYVGRPHTGETALALAAAVMVGLDPNVLWTASFQLSFCAMAGLAVFAPAWQEWGRRRAAAAFPRHDNLASTAALFTDAVAISLAAMAAVYPLLAYYFQSVAVVGLFATLLAILALPGIIICTALTAFLGLAWIPLGWVAGWAAWLLDSYLAAVVQAFNALPFASIPIGRMDAWLLLACYAVIIILWQAVVHRQRLFLLFRRGPPPVITAVPHPVPAAKPRPLLAWFIPPLLILAALAWTAALSLPGHELKVSFLDVGQGEAILVQTGDKALLVDGGPGTRAVTLALGRALPFWQRDLDAVILTQPQADHLSGLLPVLDRYHIKKAYGPGLKAGTATARAWEARLAELAVPREALHAGQYLDLGRGIKLSALNPPASLTPGAAGDPNADGLVLRLDWNEVSFLLTADIDAATERRLIAQRALLEADVLKVAHHGSRTSTSQAFLNAVRPTTAVISAGARNPFGHPHPEVLDRLQSSLKPGNIYLTSTAGTVTFTTDGSHLWVRSGT
jgi:competence protein ComEC